MPHKIDIEEAAALLRSRSDLLDDGYTERGLARAIEAGTIRRVRRGWYVPTDAWTSLWPEGRHLLEVLAVSKNARGELTFSHASAAVVHGLPLYRLVPTRVHAVTGTHRCHSSMGVARHERPLTTEEIALVGGLHVTSLDRTAFDLAGALPIEAAVSAVDAALRAVLVTGHDYDTGRVAEWRDAMADRLAAQRGSRGVRQARAVIAFADGRAQLPGESVSRLQLQRLGIRVTDLQVRVPAPHRGAHYPDFELGDVGAFGEFDGEEKYLDAAMRSGRTIDQVLLEEKRREDWIRGTTGKRVVRWGERDIASAARLGRRLASFGIVATR